ncbi:MAG: S9 family peptidase [Bacteroidales bacterium]|nr:S9 family peptidase [Bacteroidales bacterium]
MKNIFIVFCLIVLTISYSCKKKNSDYFFEQPLSEAEKQNKRLTPEILWKFGRITEAELSPDGKEIAFVVKRYDLSKNKGNAEIFVISTEGGQPEQLTFTLASESSIHWTPDGKKIGYLAPADNGTSQIWEIDRKNKKAKQISHVDGDIEIFAYSPTGKNIYFTMRVKTDSSAQDRNPDLPLSTGRVYTDLMYRHWDTWWDYKNSHLFVATYDGKKLSSIKDINEGEPYNTPLAPFYEPTEICWSADGKKIAYTSRKLKGKAEALSTNSDIYIYDIETQQTKNLSEGMLGYDRNPVFSPDGKMICWTSMATPGYEADKDRLMLYNFETQKHTDLTKNFDQSVSQMSWSEDSKHIYFISGIHATYQVYKIDVQTQNITQLTRGWHDYTWLARKGNIMVGQKMSISRATEIFRIGEDGTETQLTFINQNIYDAISMGEVRERWVTTTDNKKMLVWVIFPPNFDSTRTYPALLYCQGGPQSAVSQFFSYRWNFQLMAANGYIVIAPNRRGLPTFGQEWNDQIAQDYGGQNIKDYLSAVDEISKEPYVDKERLGAVGASYGGFSVFYLAGHHQKRFKAFIAHCGMFNFESEFGSTEEYFFEYHDIGGPYWEKPKPRGYSFSPHLFVDKWDTPILIISGEKDFRIPYTESLQAFNAAQLRGIPSKLLIFPDENHWVLKPQNSVLWQREFFGWLDQWLKKK